VVVVVMVESEMEKRKGRRGAEKLLLMGGAELVPGLLRPSVDSK
jgi:hypothetical protein